MLRMLYRPGKMLRVWNKYDVDYIKVPEADVEKHLSEGWFLRPDEMNPVPQETPEPEQPKGDLLDKSAAEIIPALKDKTLDELDALLKAEEGGKTRKGVVSAIQAEIDRKLAA